MTESFDGLKTLIVIAASAGFLHTLLGPDHYIPFTVIARAKKWSIVRTSWVTVLSGLGHVLSAVILGILGVTFGVAVTRMEALDSLRGHIAGWALIMLGLIYFIWGVRKAIRNRPHTHFHIHEDEKAHAHTHVHHREHVHVHETEGTNLTPWILFTVLVFGPCEALIPILIYPAVKGNWLGIAVVVTVFGLTTIATMLGMVLASYMGLKAIPLGRAERYSHALAGATIFVCGIMVQFMGL